jgi:hypothetical protein
MISGVEYILRHDIDARRAIQDDQIILFPERLENRSQSLFATPVAVE